jgi:uncharacterized Zn-binding protein involved in type VI secretion
MHECPEPAHVGGVILDPGSPNTLIGGAPAARMGDPAMCLGGPQDTIAKGAMPVLIGGQPAARQTDLSDHKGVIVTGEATCLIGLSGTSGNTLAGTAVCHSMAAGRKPPKGAKDPNGNQIQANTKGQSYNNCGVESSREILNATGQNHTQEGLLKQARDDGLAGDGNGKFTKGDPTGPLPPDWKYKSGGTTAESRSKLLTNNGVPANQAKVTPKALENNVAQGKGVIASVDAAKMPNWQVPGPNGTMIPSVPPNSYHAIVVTGIEYDDNGKPINVIVNDTGQGQCGISIPYADFQKALTGNPYTVTEKPIW